MSGGAAKGVRDRGAARGEIGCGGRKKKDGLDGEKVYISLNLVNSIEKY